MGKLRHVPINQVVAPDSASSHDHHYCHILAVKKHWFLLKNVFSEAVKAVNSQFRHVCCDNGKHTSSDGAVYSEWLSGEGVSMQLFWVLKWTNSSFHGTLFLGAFKSGYSDLEIWHSFSQMNRWPVALLINVYCHYKIWTFRQQFWKIYICHGDIEGFLILPIKSVVILINTVLDTV